MTPDPRTLASIGLNGSSLFRRNTTWVCGCEYNPIRRKEWYLCQYHEGYDDALTTHTETTQETTSA